MGIQRRLNRERQRMMAKVHKQFMERIKGKTVEEIAAILEQIRIKYNINEYKPDEELEFIQPESND